jgi:inosine-uridine nucleoside N-ribohydrolase
MAIILACFNEKINLVGISTTAGNQGVEKTTKNALNTLNIIGLILKNETDFSEKNDLKLTDSLEYGGLKIPVIKGCSKPLIRSSLLCGEIHGETGLEGANLPALPKNALDFIEKLSEQTKHFTTSIYEYFKALQSKITVVITGPMTNIALLLLNYPDVTKYISRIVFMGGACGIGNIMPNSEFNILVDPEAAHIVLECGVPIFMIPLEVTHTLLVTPEVLSKIREIKTKFTEAITDLLLFFKKSYQEVFGFIDPPLHDPATIAFIINPNLFYYRSMRVDIELHSSLSYGQTVCDIYNMSKKDKNVHVCLKIDVNEFWNLFYDALKKADLKSPLNED